MRNSTTTTLVVVAFLLVAVVFIGLVWKKNEAFQVQAPSQALKSPTAVIQSPTRAQAPTARAPSSNHASVNSIQNKIMRIDTQLIQTSRRFSEGIAFLKASLKERETQSKKLEQMGIKAPVLPTEVAKFLDMLKI